MDAKSRKTVRREIMLCSFCGKNNRQLRRCPKCRRMQRIKRRSVTEPNYLSVLLGATEEMVNETPENIPHEALVTPVVDKPDPTKTVALSRLIARWRSIHERRARKEKEKCGDANSVKH